MTDTNNMMKWVLYAAIVAALAYVGWQVGASYQKKELGAAVGAAAGGGLVWVLYNWAGTNTPKPSMY